eukprot:TRINITY_DN48566_c0_g1_i1.p3 TRINITY_DN48566_c0_g1~~TRINITY_DN48566_c0_g1_i1.p3  ORF type:complete len:101 (-),score=40.02 TRINITY_DN48566_c0_g1_i1:164-466(-)
MFVFFFFFFFKQKTAYEMQRGLVGSEMCIRDRAGAMDFTPGAMKNAMPTTAKNPATSTQRLIGDPHATKRMPAAELQTHPENIPGNSRPHTQLKLSLIHI